MSNLKAENIVVSCIDFRIQHDLSLWISKKFPPRSFDRVEIGGGVKDLKKILKQVEIAFKLHHIKKVFLINHEDCGAYGKEETPMKHVEDLQKTKTAIKKKHPRLEVHTYYLRLDGMFESIS